MATEFPPLERLGVTSLFEPTGEQDANSSPSHGEDDNENYKPAHRVVLGFAGVCEWVGVELGAIATWDECRCVSYALVVTITVLALYD